MATNDLLMYLVYWHQPGFLKAVGDFAAWLERQGSLDASKRLSDRKSQRKAYARGQLVAGKMSENQAGIYCCSGQLRWVRNEIENLKIKRMKRISAKYFEGSFRAHLEKRPNHEFTVTKKCEEISRDQAQFEYETSTAWQRALAANVIEV